MTLGQPGPGSTARRILLGLQLRRLREERGVSRRDAGYAIHGSESKIGRLERGRAGFKGRDVAGLLTLYGVVDEAQREALLRLARQANTPGWWDRYGDVLPSWFQTYVGLEDAASLIWTCEAQFVPGLLQTEDYARTVLLRGHPEASREEIERRVELRMRRQRRLTGPGAARLWAVIDEAALRRPVGGPVVMHDQIEHLIALSKLPNVTIQVMPFRLDGHCAESGAFTIMRFPEPGLSDVVYVETLTNALYLNKHDDIDSYHQEMERLCRDSATPQASTELLSEISREPPGSGVAGRVVSFPHRIGAVRTESRYVATVFDALGGGDVHHVVSTPFGVRLLIGDVMGKGLRAMRTAAKVLDAFRELAQHEPKLSGVAERMHAVLTHREDSEEFVTALLVAIRDEDGHAELVCCGHPPPLLLRGTQVSFVDALPRCLPLGLLDLQDGWCETATVPFAAGDRLLLYTDGMSEARDAKGQFYPLAERVAELRHDDPSVLLAALEADVLRHTAGRLKDDAALLLVHCDPGQPCGDGGHASMTMSAAEQMLK